MRPVDPVIVVPGITASSLRDEYPLPPESVWSVLSKRYERVALHPDDFRLEALEPARVRPDQIFEVAYEDLVDELRYNLSPSADRPVPVYPFGYDWRQPLDVVEAVLADFVQEVIDRTRLMPHYAGSDYVEAPRVNLVGHSMGGLVITGYLQGLGGDAPVNKVATLATPYQGSYEAILKVITGTANLGTRAPSSREREAARLTPALYHLLPSFPGALEPPAELPDSLFDPAIWQPTVVESIAESIRRVRDERPSGPRAARTRERRAEAAERFGRLLALARQHRDRIDAFELAAAGLSDRDWLAVVGADAKTRVRIQVGVSDGEPQFELRSADRRNAWSETDPRAARATGDGTVPFEGALPRFLEENQLVVVTPEDFGYWELQDRALARVAGFHGILPNMNMLHRMLVRFFSGGADRRGNTWGRRVPGVSEADWDPPLELEPEDRS